MATMDQTQFELILSDASAVLVAFSCQVVPLHLPLAEHAFIIQDVEYIGMRMVEVIWEIPDCEPALYVHQLLIADGQEVMPFVLIIGPEYDLNLVVDDEARQRLHDAFYVAQMDSGETLFVPSMQIRELTHESGDDFDFIAILHSRFLMSTLRPVERRIIARMSMHPDNVDALLARV